MQHPKEHRHQGRCSSPPTTIGVVTSTATFPSVVPLLPVPRIRLLPEVVINRIAAGEVVERPASVVKELVENSLDAGASTVIVRLRQGGMRTIEVSDDGCGMDGDDALLALERHATSKLDDDANLAAISTLGFRGEALPSIAAVSRLVLETAAHPGEGTRVECDFGRIRSVRPAACPPGTRVEVSDLFEHLPARRKFLRTPETELRHTVVLLNALALTRPALSVLLVHNDRTVFHLPPARDLLARLPDLYGAKRAAAVTHVSHQQGESRVTGFLLTTSSARQVTLAVNGRVVRDRFLTAVAHRSLRSSSGVLQAEGFIHLEVPPHLVDVNVHPTKAEVRFVNPSEVAAMLTAALAAALIRFHRPAEVRRVVAAPPPSIGRPIPTRSFPPAPPPPSVAETVSPAFPAPAQITPFGRLVGQYRGTYLVVEDADGLLLIDQHVAHERILYEELLARDASVALQPLLLPLVVELRPEHAALAIELQHQLRSLGLEIEPLSGNTVRVVAAPPGFTPALLERALPVLLDDAEAGAAAGETFRLRAAATLACQAAIKQNTPLSPPEAEHLLANLARAKDPHRCPHGRPIALRLSHAEIERRIGRT